MGKSVSLVLSSGSARGVAHIGVIEELEHQGFEIKSIAGSSMGALVGGIYASGKMDVFKNWICNLDKKSVLNLVDFTLSSTGLVKGEKIIQELLKMIPDVNIEALPIPFRAIATDIKNRKEVIFEGGSLFEAIRASISIPTIFKPFQYNEMILIDGGVLNPIPINRVIRIPNDLLVAVDVSAPVCHGPKSTSEADTDQIVDKLNYFSIIRENGYRFLPTNDWKKNNYYTILSQSASMMAQQISALSMKAFPPDILIRIPEDSFESYHFHKSAEIIEMGKVAAKKALLEFSEKKQS
jgi:NTE family protein